MEPKLDSFIVDAWTEFIRLRKMEALEDLDTKSQDILFIVGGSQMRGERVIATDIVAALRWSSSYSTTIVRLRKLVSDGWLVTTVVNNRGRSTNYRLTPKAIQYMNTLSQVIRNHYGSSRNQIVG